MIKNDWMKKAATNIIDMLHELELVGRTVEEVTDWDVEEHIWWAYKYRNEVEEE